jgi:hypothetical protein
MSNDGNGDQARRPTTDEIAAAMVRQCDIDASLSRRR